MERVGVDEPGDAPTVVPVHEEPRHHLVHESPGLRLLDVQVPPGDVSLFHEHHEPTLYVTLADAPVASQRPGGEWELLRSTLRSLGEITDRCDYVAEPLVHRIRNDGERPFRLLGVVNHEAGEDGLVATDDAELVNQWFVVRRLASVADVVESGATLVLVHPASGTWQVVGPGQAPAAMGEGDIVEIQVGRAA